MSTDVANYLANAFSGRRSVDADVLLTAMFYIEKSQGLPAVGASPQLSELLAREEFSSDACDFLKQQVLAFMMDTTDPELFSSAITVLQGFRDDKLKPLLITWLDAHLRGLLRENRVVSQLLSALQSLDEAVPARSAGPALIESNVETARAYLANRLGLQYPW